MTTVAVLGLGAMGLPMARCLSSTFTVRCFDVAADRRALAQADSLAVCGSASEAADGAQVAVVAVRNQAQLDSLLWGEDPVAGSMAEGGAVVLTSTVGIDAVREVAAKLSAEGLYLVDAPVSGGPVRAGNGDLLVTVGASDRAWEISHPVLDTLASTLKRIGLNPGDGQAMKTVNQLLCGVHIAAAGEALALASTLGLDTEAALETLMAGAAASFMLGAEVRSRLDIFVKDMGIVTSAARSAGLAVPVASAAEQLYLLGQAQGKQALDDSAIITVIAPEPHHGKQ